MRILALLFALTAVTAWGFGAVLLKRGTDVVTPATILALQYLAGLVLVAAWIVLRRDSGATLAAVERRWPSLLLLVLLQIGGYIAFVLAVKYAGAGSLPTSAIVAIAASYPALVAVLSGPMLGENLAWNHAVAVGLVVSGVVVAQA